MSKDKREKITVTTYNWGPCLVKLKIADEFKKLLKMVESTDQKKNLKNQD